MTTYLALVDAACLWHSKPTEGTLEGLRLALSGFTDPGHCELATLIREFLGSPLDGPFRRKLAAFTQEYHREWSTTLPETKEAIARLHAGETQNVW